jgi:predicted metal-dependent hydrolase
MSARDLLLEHRDPNAGAVVTSILEAVSFVTPALEVLLIHSVAAHMPHETELRERCLEFMRDEARHRRMHMHLNAAFLQRQSVPPRGLAQAEHALKWLPSRLSPASRLRLVAAFEHFTSVLAAHYLVYSERWSFVHPELMEVFDAHARDELGHCSLAVDLCQHARVVGRLPRALTLACVVAATTTYLVISVPSILGQKTGHGFLYGLGRLLKLIAANLRETVELARELSRFASARYIPRIPIA